MTQKIDDLDVKVIRELKKDARTSYREISERLGVSEGTVYNRVQKMREIGVIKRFIPEIDYSKLGYDLAVLIGIRVDGGYLGEVEKVLASEPNVSAVFDVTGDYDTMVIAKFRGREELNDLVKRVLAVPHVRRTHTMLVLNTVKEEHGIEI
ncbi:AsnC family transcriptional regulator [Methanosarcinales archaeon]|uniref:AsnC family transcriptional regulator n=1 Tax=Candidatus Syntropharchaeum caldarium TaxID=1838285 RepID=A0A1F2PA09_9EURY|nr:MAG: AsnC family transcriptional regulator [Candidatus Syntrophoarchaeum caldarius]RLG35875.1 MAG: AsnC family transcriptional regulator [Methanosarcinales archaeon]